MTGSVAGISGKSLSLEVTSWVPDEMIPKQRSGFVGKISKKNTQTRIISPAKKTAKMLFPTHIYMQSKLKGWLWDPFQDWKTRDKILWKTLYCIGSMWLVYLAYIHIIYIDIDKLHSVYMYDIQVLQIVISFAHIFVTFQGWKRDLHFWGPFEVTPWRSWIWLL